MGLMLANAYLESAYHRCRNNFDFGTQVGPDYHTRRVVTERKIRNHIAHLTAMGFHVTLQPAA